MRTAMRAVCPLSVFALALLSNPMRGGRELPAQPEDAVIPNELVVKLRPGASGSFDDALPPGTQRRVANKLNTFVFRTGGNVPRSMVENLARNPNVEYVEPNRIRQNTAVAPNDPSYATQWALSTVEALKSWSIIPNRYAIPTGGRIRVAVLDTGTDCSHPDFKNAGGTSSDSAAGGQLRWASSAALVGSIASAAGCAWADDHGHGTHVAGTIAAASHNAAGVAALGYPIEIMTFKVLGSNGSGDDATISDAIISAADNGAHVISLSLGGSGYSQSMQDAVNYAWERNVLVVAAAGNSNSSSLFFPAGAHRAVGVAATDRYNLKASYSNHGKSVDIAAPGSSILSTYPTYAVSGSSSLNYKSMSGTSMATPHVSALAGLLSLTTPSAPVDAIVSRIQQSAQSQVASGGWDQYLGYGIINAFKAVNGELRPSTSGAITGQAVDANGLPLSGVTVSAGGASFTTAADGLFRIAPLAPGSQVLTAARTGMTTRTMNVIVPAGADASITVPMGVTLGTIQGVVTNGGSLLSNVVVQAKQSGLVKHTSFTSGTGAFELTVEPGTYQLLAGGVGHAGSPVIVTVAAGGVATANLTAVPFGNIQGTVRSGGAAVPGAQISFTSSTASFGAIADAAGSFSSIGLPAGTYSVVCSAPGKPDSAPASVSVTYGVSERVDCNLGGGGTEPAGVTLTLSPSSLTGGTSGSGNQVTLSSPAPAGGATVALTSSNPAVASVQASIVIPAGATSSPVFTISTSSVTTTTNVVVTASHGGASTTQTLEVKPATSSSSVALADLILRRDEIVGGQSSGSHIVRLAAVAPAGGVTVALTSSHPAVASVPASVTIPAGVKDFGSLTITTVHVSSPVTVTITATLDGVSKSKTVRIVPVTPSYVKLSTTSVTGGTPVKYNRVGLTAVAPAGGTVVTMSSSNPALVTVPGTVTVAAGQSVSPQFAITTSPVTNTTIVTISATYGGTTVSAVLTLNP